MKNLVLAYNEESGAWEERKEPYITLEVETEEDYEHLKAAVEFYQKRDKLVEVVHGRWIEKEHEAPYGGYHLFHCSECDSPNARKRNYCPECGAKMDGGEAHA